MGFRTLLSCNRTLSSTARGQSKRNDARFLHFLKQLSRCTRDGVLQMLDSVL